MTTAARRGAAAEVRLAARHSEALTGAVLEAELDCIVIMDGKGRVVEFNPTAVAVFGYERAEASAGKWPS